MGPIKRSTQRLTKKKERQKKDKNAFDKATIGQILVAFVAFLRSNMSEL